MSSKVLDFGTQVVTSDGEHVGDLRHIVLERKSHKVTHIVVDIGLLRAGREVLERGLAGDYDRTIAFSDITEISDSGITLRLTRPEFMAQERYTAEHFERPHDLTPGRVDLSDVIGAGMFTLGVLPTIDPAIWLVPTLNKDRGERDIREGTPVWRQEPHEKIGEVREVLLDEHSEVRAFVIDRGLGKSNAILPTYFVTELLDGIVRVQIEDAELEALQPYDD